MDSIDTILTAIIGSMLVSFGIAIPLIWLLYKLKITRSLEADYSSLIEGVNKKEGTPIMGGLIIIISVTIINLVFNPLNSNDGLLLLLTLFLISALLGGLDDILNIYGWNRKSPRALSRTLLLIKVHKSLKKRVWLLITFPWELYKRVFFVLGSNPGKGIQAHEKILVQSIIGIALGVGIFFYSSRENPGEVFLPIISESINIGFLIIPFAWLTVLLVSNAVNISDGMDGLSSSLLLSSFLGFLVIAIWENDVRIAYLIATVVGGLISYLYFNTPPARFQMGDVGSLALGTLLASVAFILGYPLFLLIFGFPFVIELLSTIIQGVGRRILGRRILKMAPIHHHLQMAYDWKEEKIVMRLALFSLVCLIVGLWFYFI